LPEQANMTPNVRGIRDRYVVLGYRMSYTIL
jgi:hypothetical protein